MELGDVFLEEAEVAHRVRPWVLRLHFDDREDFGFEVVGRQPPVHPGRQVHEGGRRLGRIDHPRTAGRDNAINHRAPRVG